MKYVVRDHLTGDRMDPGLLAERFGPHYERIFRRCAVDADGRLIGVGITLNNRLLDIYREDEP